MKATLILERLGKDGALLERKEQQSRSFVKQFIDLLYIQVSGILVAAPFDSYNVDGSLQPIDVTTAETKGCHMNLRISSPGGQGDVYGPFYNQYWARSTCLGCDLGIMVGVDNTAVTPLDFRLGQRIGHGRRPADGGAVMFENYTINDDTTWTGDAVGDWAAQPFIPAISHRLTSVWVQIFKTGAPGDITISIRGPRHVGNEDDNYSGNEALATGTIAEGDIPGASPGALTQCVFATPFDVYAGHRYYLTMSAPGGSGGNSIGWRYDTAAATYLRACQLETSNVFTSRHQSTNSGATWDVFDNSCFMFSEWGQSVGEFEYGGTELVGLAFADPDGEFTIRRYFENQSGVAITVNEVGITAASIAHGSTTITTSYLETFLIAHDVVGGGIAVADGELLRVTYVPQITV